MRYVFAFDFFFQFSIFSADILRSSPLMACWFLSHIFQDGQCLRSFCAPSLGMLQEVLSSFDNSLPKQGHMSQIQSWITSPIQSDSCTCIQIRLRNHPAVRPPLLSNLNCVHRPRARRRARELRAPGAGCSKPMLPRGFVVFLVFYGFQEF